jgi:hypothetical protein
MNTEKQPKTARQVNKETRDRLKRVKKRLPDNMVSVFLWKYPELKSFRILIHNVLAGKSLNMGIILKLEDFANLISPDK